MSNSLVENLQLKLKITFPKIAVVVGWAEVGEMMVSLCASQPGLDVAVSSVRVNLGNYSGTACFFKAVTAVVKIEQALLKFTFITLMVFGCTTQQ